MKDIINRLRELRHIIDVAAETNRQSTLPPNELIPFIRNKIYLVMQVLTWEIFPYRAGSLTPQWNYWCHHTITFLKSEAVCDFHYLLCHLLDGFLEILGDHTKWTKRLVDGDGITTGSRSIQSEQSGLAASH